MTKITLSTGDKYTLNKHASDIMKDIERRGWVMLEDDGRDLAIRADHIVAVEEDSDAILKEAIQAAEQNLINTDLKYL